MHTTEQPPRRTRLSPKRKAELYTTVVELLREIGYEAFATPAVAARCRSSTATLYRQWGGKPGLVVAALQYHQGQTQVLNADTGTLRGDPLELARRVHRIAPAEYALSHVALCDPKLARAMLLRPIWSWPFVHVVMLPALRRPVS